MSIQKTITPINNTVYLERELASDSQINSVIEKGSTGFEIWKKTSLDDRISIVNKFIDNTGYTLNNFHDDQFEVQL